MSEPGPAPTPLVFPDGEARSLASAIDRLAGDLAAALGVHRAARETDLRELLGPQGDRFAVDLSAHLGRLQRQRDRLLQQREHLREAVAAADAQVAQRRADRQRWELAVRAHRSTREVG